MSVVNPGNRGGFQATAIECQEDLQPGDESSYLIGNCEPVGAARRSDSWDSRRKEGQTDSPHLRDARYRGGSAGPHRRPESGSSFRNNASERL